MDKIGQRIAAWTTIGVLGLAGTIGWLMWNSHQKFLKKISAVSQHVQDHGTLEYDFNGRKIRVFEFDYNGRKVQAFHENGLGFEFNKRESVKSRIYETAVQGGKKLATDIAKDSLGLRREGDKVDLIGDRVLPEYSDSIIDHNLDGMDEDDTYIEWLYDPTLKSKEEEKKSGKGKDTYSGRIKKLGGLVKDVMKASKGEEVEDPKEEIVINKRMNKNRPLEGVKIGKRRFVERNYKGLVERAYEEIREYE